MTTNSETARLARRVDSMVKTYMIVQEDLFKPSLRKILRLPGIYRPVNYEENGAVLKGLLDELAEVKGAIRSESPDASSVEENFLGVLRGYVSIMTRAVEKLLFICGRLNERSKGAPYGAAEYKNDMTELRKIQKKHLETGLKLNSLMKDLSSSEPLSSKTEE